jgi:cell division protein FtsN
MRGGRGRRAPSRLASSLFVIGCLGVLGATFMAGVMAGRFWPRAQPAPSTTAEKPGAPARPGDKTARAGDKSGRPAEPAPALTFYQDLTAPLTAPPPPKAVKPGRAEKAERPASPEAVPRPERAALPEAAAPAATTPPATPGAFTIQVGAYKAREPAEALRARLAAAGHDAYVAEIDASGSVRYRVRVGSFVTREAAQLAADKIVAAERKLSAFVTAR